MAPAPRSTARSEAGRARRSGGTLVAPLPRVAELHSGRFLSKLPYSPIVSYPISSVCTTTEQSGAGQPIIRKVLNIRIWALGSSPGWWAATVATYYPSRFANERGHPAL